MSHHIQEFMKNCTKSFNRLNAIKTFAYGLNDHQEPTLFIEGDTIT